MAGNHQASAAKLQLKINQTELTRDDFKAANQKVPDNKGHGPSSCSSAPVSAYTLIKDPICVLLVDKMSAKDISYSDKYYDEAYEYRHVILPKQIAARVPKTHLMTESEWRDLGEFAGLLFDPMTARFVLVHHLLSTTVDHVMRNLFTVSASMIISKTQATVVNRS